MLGLRQTDFRVRSDRQSTLATGMRHGARMRTWQNFLTGVLEGKCDGLESLLLRLSENGTTYLDGSMY